MTKPILIVIALLLFAQIPTYAQSPSDVAIEKASESMAKGDLSGAMTALDECIAGGQDLYPCFNRRSQLRRMVGNFAASLDDLNSAIEIKSDDGELFERRAMLRLYQRQDPKLILSDLDTAIALGRKIENVYTQRGLIKRQLNDLPGAISDLQTAIGLAPDSPGPYQLLGGIYSSQGRYDEATTLLENFVKVFENSGKPLAPLNERIVVSTSNQTPPTTAGRQANEVHQVSITPSPGGPRKLPPTREELDQHGADLARTKNIAELYCDLAALYRRRGNIDDALALLDKAEKIDPNAFYAHETRALIAEDKGDYSAAVDHFSAFLKVGYTIPRIYLERGFAYLMLGRDSEAKTDFDAYLALYPAGTQTLDKWKAEAKRRLSKK